MSTHKPKGRPYYLYDFWLQGHRFHGTTKCASKRDADLFEKVRRKEAADELKAAAALGREPMTFGVAATRYWDEVGQFAATQDDIWRTLAWLQREISANRRIASINDGVVIRLRTARRQETTKQGKVVAPATVNRTLEVLRSIVARASKLWGEPVAPIDWRRHMMKEPDERVRELRGDEEAAMFAALRPDYHAIVRFALLTGCRLNECVTLRWKDVDWGGRQIWILGKGNKLAPIPLPPTVRELLWPLQGEHDEFVFTYVAERTRGARRHGQRYPITYEGLKTAFRRDVKPAVPGYRFHDNRHTAATRVLRACGNLKVAQKMLRHADITTTAKYAHVMHDDVLEAMEKAARASQAGHPAADEAKGVVNEG
ncbi:tyrosine-type recombinase/integrase [Methylobacterium nigriterrae]|uniref:tyrosine-type recombinase/integrase n=1 Tax=Methylobacterium nigriterrae TaxID=3127512 RepID=UPI0030141160